MLGNIVLGKWALGRVTLSCCVP